MSGQSASSSSALDGGLIYETARAVSEYLEFHYGPEHLGVPNFPRSCAATALAALEAAGHAGRGRGLDVGCAVGRSAFELSAVISQVDAVDFSHAFVEVARQLGRGEEVPYEIATEGALTLVRSASLRRLGVESSGLAATASRVAASQGDACTLPESLTGYDLVLAANLIDRLHDPAVFLESMAGRIVPGGVLALTSPYTWLESYTPPERWLGGRVVDGRARTSFEGIARLLEPRFRLVKRCDIPFVIRETSRKYQHTIAEFTGWQRLPESSPRGPAAD